MNLLELVNRNKPPEPWAEGDNIPWNDPGFSERMLKEHLSQDHDAASRRSEIIDRHVAWIHTHVLRGAPTRVLDLGCGPGLYASRLARLGHSCTGIDFSPASIAYASAQATAQGLDCRYIGGDIRSTPYGSGFGLVMLIFGEFNVFKPADARLILDAAYQALDPGGVLMLEPHLLEAIEKEGREPASWYSCSSGLFLDSPHVYLEEHFWDAERSVTTTRYFVLDAVKDQIIRYASSMQGYTEAAYREALGASGFAEIAIYPSLEGSSEPGPYGLCAITARKPRA